MLHEQQQSPSEVSKTPITIASSESRKNAAIRGVNLDPADMADLQLLAKADRRSFSFMVRDAISEFLQKRREQLERLKNSEGNS